MLDLPPMWMVPIPRLTKKAPDFTLKSLDGKDVTLSEHKGKVILLHFFAMFSRASGKQLPQMEKLHQENKERGLVIIGVTTEKDLDKLRKFATQNKLSYPILLDARKVFKDYKLGQIPDVCLINKDLVVSSMYLGFNPCEEEEIKAEVEKLLKTIEVPRKTP